MSLDWDFMSVIALKLYMLSVIRTNVRLETGREHVAPPIL